MKAPKTPWAKHPIVRILVIWVIQTLALLIMAALMSGVQIDSIGYAFIAAGIIGLLNALLWPLLTNLLVPFEVLTLGIGALLINGLIIWIAAWLEDDIFGSVFTLNSYWSAFWLALGMSAINIILSTLLSIDDEHSWSRNQVKRRMQRIAKPEPTDVPGILFLEIDGLAKPVLEKALAEGFMPTLKRWIESGSHVVTPWETDTSSQTSASQSGILHGDNSNIPAFRWYDKEKGEIIASSNTKILPDLEAERSDGNGLLSADGASRGNLLSGDAPHVMTTASTLTDRGRFHTSEFQAYFANPYNMSRTLLLFLWDVFLEWRQFRWARKNDVSPVLDKHHRGRTYPFIRATMTVLMRELNIYTLLGDIFAGRPSAYATFVGYDEVAHHSGVLDPGVFDILHKLDQQFARLERAIEEAPRPYHLVILSDHGQTGGATFQQRYGKSLLDLVQELMTAEVTVGGSLATREGASHVGFMLTDAVHNNSAGTSKVVGRTFKKQMVDGHVVIGHESRAEHKEREEDDEHPEVYTLASGNLGLISFTRWPERMTMEQLDEAYPALLPGLVEHEGVGFIMVRSAEHGPVVIGAEGTRFLHGDRIEGEDPLKVFGPNAAYHLRRTDSFPSCPDILVNSFYDPETDEGCAFEELIGFHGGLGGPQTQPFILHPAELQANGEMIGAASVYHLCKGWLNALHGDSSGSPEPALSREQMPGSASGV